MNILFAASEVAPFIKTGGLADVAGSLPAALAGRGNDVRVALPLYGDIGQEWREQMDFLGFTYVHLSWRNVYCGVFSLKRGDVTCYFLDNEYYFKREGLYGHFDDAERYAFFSRAVLALPDQVDWTPDVIHCNDWQTALTPVYLLEEREQNPRLAGTKSVYTIHNIEYQGRYGKEVLGDVFGLNDGYLSEDMLGYFGDVNLMKGAMNAADYITTVSPTYAEELRYAFYAHGLDGVAQRNQWKMRGILNGIDMEVYNPATDRAIQENFSPEALDGKRACKAALQRTLGLKAEPEAPMIACVSRLVGHKGFELVKDMFDRIMELPVQFVLLGTGEWGYEQFFREAQNRYPTRVSVNIMYSGALSSAIYAGADLFLMPSVSEPCGLSQMIAMRYGTVPVVRETGGLKDSVPPVRGDEGLGFTFANIEGEDMLDAIRRGVEAYGRRDSWQAVMRRGMEADFSWNHSAGEYLEIYRTILNR